MRVDKKIFGWAGFAIYLIVLFLLLTLYRLPADKLVAAGVETLSRGRLLLRAERVSLLPPLRFKLEGVSYGLYLGDDLIGDSLKSLTLAPDYGGLFSGYLSLKILGVLDRGSFEGKIGVSMISGVKKGYLIMKANDLSLDDLNILGPLLKRDLKGKLKSEIEVRGNLTNPAELNGRGYVQLEKGYIGTRFDLPGFDRVPFDRIKVDFTVKDGTLVLNEGALSGPMLSGSLTGEIRLENKPANSRLKITARLTPGPLLEKNPLARQFFKATKKGKRAVTIKIGGTLNRPSIKLIKS